MGPRNRMGPLPNLEVKPDGPEKRKSENDFQKREKEILKLFSKIVKTGIESISLIQFQQFLVLN
jgi:hypothetical protein